MINRICKKIRQIRGGMREYDWVSYYARFSFHLIDINDKWGTFWIGVY